MSSSARSPSISFASGAVDDDEPGHGPRVLIVGHDEDHRSTIAETLGRGGFTTTESPSASLADDPNRQADFDLIVLDGRLGQGGAVTISRRLAESQNAPIMILSDTADVAERVIALEVGADELMARPFDGRELVARARALVRQAVPKVRAAPARPAANSAALYLRTRTLVGPNKARVLLQPMLVSMLRLFLSRPGDLLNTEDVAKYLQTPVAGTQLRSSISRLRRKLAEAGLDPDLVVSVKKLGYRLEGSVAIHIVPN